MPSSQSPRQRDLFEVAQPAFGRGYASLLQEPPPADFIERIRNELVGTLAMARGAVRMPWRDLTAATLAELRFNSITNWLPASEGEALRESFNREMARLWAAAASEAQELPQEPAR
jgi:hypothetical protein